MTDPLAPGAAELLQRLEALERRVDALEGAPQPRPQTAARAVAPPAIAPTPPAQVRHAATDTAAAPDLLPLVGQTLFVFAGAFLLRAATESAYLPPTLGSGVGILYAGIWILVARRHADRGNRAAASLFGLAAAGIAYPLLWESTISFGFLSPMLAALALAAIGTGGFLVATRYRLGALAAAYTVGSAVTALALALGTKVWALFIGEVLVLTVLLMALPAASRWPLLEWLLSAISAACLMLMTVTWTVSPPERVADLFGADQLLGLQLGWVLAVIAVLAWRTLRTAEPMDGAEVTQGLAALAVGFGGALIVAARPEVGTAPVGWVGLILAAGCYGAAFALADRRLGRRNFVFYGSVGLLVTLIASFSLLTPPTLTALLATIGMLMAVAGWQRSRATLTLHAAVYVASAAWAAGLLHASLRALRGADLPAAGWIDLEVALVLVVAALASWLPVAMHGRTWGRYSRLPKVLLEVVLLLGAAAVLVSLLAAALLSGLSGGAHLAALDALRSGVIAATAMVVAWLGRFERWPEAAWMVYPILGVGAAKLLLVDLPDGTPLSLVFSLLFYGGALIVAPRLARN